MTPVIFDLNGRVAGCTCVVAGFFKGRKALQICIYIYIYVYTTESLCVCTMRSDKISRWNNSLVKGMLIRFVTKNSVQVYAHLIRLQFVAIIEFVGIQSASLSAIYGFLIHLFRVPVFLSIAPCLSRKIFPLLVVVRCLFLDYFFQNRILSQRIHMLFAIFLFFLFALFFQLW